MSYVLYINALTMFSNMFKIVFAYHNIISDDNNSIFEQNYKLMSDYISYSLFAFLIVGCLLMLAFVVYSYKEKEQKAFNRALTTTIILGILITVIAIIPETTYVYILILPLVLLVVTLLKFGNKTIKFKIPDTRFDERDVMFSRNTLIPNSQKYNDYYKLRPENKPADDTFRKEPGLMAKGATFYNEMLFHAAHATFKTVNLLQPGAEQPSSEVKSQIQEKVISDFIKNWTIKLGAVDVGFTNIKPHHIYTHIGRGEEYGKEVTLNHTHAIAFTVEMSHEFLSYNPKGPVVMESAQQYLNAGQIAIQLTEFIRNLGYDARAHIDANYRLICPIVAQDAGLGTIGRMGLLMTPNLGPRVRIGVVSTNLNLPVNTKSIDYSVIHFCEVCKKCATNCPSQSVPTNSVKNTSNPERWTINQESCFTYWCKVGTDCGRCVAVCPYSHPDNFIHNCIRWMIKRNPINRWLALQLDDFFYGRKPTSNKLKSWMNP